MDHFGGGIPVEIAGQDSSFSLSSERSQVPFLVSRGFFFLTEFINHLFFLKLLTLDAPFLYMCVFFLG